MVILEQGQWPQVMSTKGNAPGSNRKKTPLTKCQTVFSWYSVIWVHIFPRLSRNSWNPIGPNANFLTISVLGCRLLSLSNIARAQNPRFLRGRVRGTLARGGVNFWTIFRIFCLPRLPPLSCWGTLKFYWTLTKRGPAFPYHFSAGVSSALSL